MKTIITREQLRDVLNTPDVRAFIKVAREAITRSVNNVALTIPESIVWIIRDETASRSKLIPFVNAVRAKGRERVFLPYTIPEAVWTDACDNVNELDMDIRQMIFDCFKLSGFVTICNATMEDSDRYLFDVIVSGMGAALAKAVDKAILYGTGEKMPIGIATRLSQTEQPYYWSLQNPTWTDLHETNIKKLPLDPMYAAPFMQPLADALSIAEPVYSEDGLFWAMNRKTHRHILAKARDNHPITTDRELDTMPDLGGAIVEFPADVIPDYQIIGGYGSHYLLAERADFDIATSDQTDLAHFLDGQSVIRANGYYDGAPVAGEAFVIVKFDGTVLSEVTDPVTSVEFAEDTANAEPTGDTTEP